MKEITDDFNWKSLPKVALSEKKHLPHSPGIYFVAWNDKLQYIGITTKSLRYRWIQHHRYYQACNASSNSAEIYYLEPNNSLEDTERWLIKKLCPPLNGTTVPKVYSFDIPPKENETKKIAVNQDEKVKVEMYVSMKTYRQLLLWGWIKGKSPTKLCSDVITEEIDKNSFMISLEKRARDKGITVERLEQHIYKQAGLNLIFKEFEEFEDEIDRNKCNLSI